MPKSDQPATIQGKVIATSSFENGEGNPEHSVDGDPETFWHSRWSHDEAQPPHFLVLDYGKPLKIAALIYTARTDGDNGHVKDYELYVSDDAQTWGNPVARGRVSNDQSEKAIRLEHPVTARYLKFVILSEQHNHPFASVAELEVEVEKPGDSSK
ncbi:MAG TPA: discoidin domain-containing protein [Verrucomicrobiae bacterium]